MWIPGPRLNTVFRSRWRALFWAASVLLTVYFFVSHGQDDAPEAAGLIGGANTAASSASSEPPNPWAPTPASH